jgi:hypothetical protein
LVAAAGGVPSNVTKTGSDYPVFLPDGRHFLYLVTAESLENNGVYLSSLDGSENRRVLADVSSVVFAPLTSGGRAGHLLFIRDNTLMAQPFDAGSAQLSGDAFPIAEGVSFGSTSFVMCQPPRWPMWLTSWPATRHALASPPANDSNISPAIINLCYNRG